MLYGNDGLLGTLASPPEAQWSIATKRASESIDHRWWHQRDSLHSASSSSSIRLFGIPLFVPVTWRTCKHLLGKGRRRRRENEQVLGAFRRLLFLFLRLGKDASFTLGSSLARTLQIQREEHPHAPCGYVGLATACFSREIVLSLIKSLPEAVPALLLLPELGIRDARRLARSLDERTSLWLLLIRPADGGAAAGTLEHWIHHGN